MDLLQLGVSNNLAFPSGQCSGHKEDVGVICGQEQAGESQAANSFLAAACTASYAWAICMSFPSSAVPAVTARLVDATSAAGQTSGRLELLHEDSWVPACRSGLGDQVAAVVCKQVGCAGACAWLQHCATMQPGSAPLACSSTWVLPACLPQPMPLGRAQAPCGCRASTVRVWKLTGSPALTRCGAPLSATTLATRQSLALAHQVSWVQVMCWSAASVAPAGALAPIYR